MNIERIYTLEGEAISLKDKEYPSIIEKVDYSAIDDEGLKYLQDQMKSLAKLWSIVYLQDKRPISIRFAIYSNYIFKSRILKDDCIDKIEQNNFSNGER
jgi:hypothetical protein